VIDFTQERLLTFEQAAELLPAATRPSMATWCRWARHGLNGRRLETFKLGRRRFTTREAVARFATALNGGWPAGDAPEQAAL